MASNSRKEFSSIDSNGSVEEGKIDVDGVNINYLRVGTGEHPILLLPGVAGSMRTAFKPQIEGLDRNKFTIVAWDPPGCGKSRPPDRTYPDDILQRDAVRACNLMKLLGYTKFSLIGWCAGGTTSFILASMFPQNIRKMVSVAGNSYITPKEIEIYKKVGDVDTWPEQMRAPMIKLYGEEYFRRIWGDWFDANLRIYEKQNGDLCKNCLPKIECPTLIIHGSEDTVVLAEHSLYLKENIVGAKLRIFEDGGHALHLGYPEEFNQLVTEFLTE